MATVGSLAVASDIADAALDYHVRGGALYQNQQERPLLAFLNAGKKTFPGGKDAITEPVQGVFMSDTSGFFAGYTRDENLTFTQGGLLDRTSVSWKTTHAGFVIAFTELLQDGISIQDGEQRTSDHSETFLTRLTGIMENRLNDFSESYARAFNLMLWQDGSQDSKQVPGVQSLIVETPNTGTRAGISADSYSWWRNRVNLSLVASPENQTIATFFRNEVIQLRRYGGRPSKALCGSAFWNALSTEVEKKGVYTQSGFAGTTNIGMDGIALGGLKFEYDPTLDDLGFSKRCYVFDSRRIKLMPIEGEENKIMKPARPYQNMVLLRSMTWAGGLSMNQANAHGLYAIA